MIWRRKTGAVTTVPPKLGLGAGTWLETAGEALAALGSGAGGAVALVTGKLLLAALLGLVACGLVMRLLARRKLADRQRPLPPAPWMRLAAGIGAAALCAALVEAVKLPVRYDQPGFERSNWLIVLAALLVLYSLLLGLVRRIATRRQATDTEPA